MYLPKGWEWDRAIPAADRDAIAERILQLPAWADGRLEAVWEGLFRTFAPAVAGRIVMNNVDSSAHEIYVPGGGTREVAQQDARTAIVHEVWAGRSTRLGIAGTGAHGGVGGVRGVRAADGAQDLGESAIRLLVDLAGGARVCGRRCVRGSRRRGGAAAAWGRAGAAA